MTPEARAELLRLCEAATRDPWYYQEGADVYTHIIRAGEHRFVCQLPQDSSGAAETMARDIVAARSAVPDLLAENERLREALRRSDLIMERYVDEMVAGDDLRSVRKAVVEALAGTPADDPTRERQP